MSFISNSTMPPVRPCNDCPRSLPVPGLRAPIAAGDALKNLTSRLGIPTCGGCEKRRQLLNQLFQFRPAGGGQ